MATNDLYNKILKQVFKGNIGRQLRLLREHIEVKEFEEYCKNNNITPNRAQQEFIDNHYSEFNQYDLEIRNITRKLALKDIPDPDAPPAP